MTEIIGILLLGVCVGLVSSILGLGGGVLMVPLLPLISSVSQREVIATSLLTIFLVAIKNTVHFHRHRLVRWEVGLAIGIMTGLCAGITSHYNSLFTDEQLILILNITIFILLLRGIFFRPKPLNIKLSKLTGIYIGCAVGLVSGILSGLIGIGGGVFISAVLLSFQLVHHKEVSPTTNLTMVFTGLGAVTSFFLEGIDLKAGLIGPANFKYSLLIFLAAWLSSNWGVKYQNKLDIQQRKWLMVTILFIVFLKGVYPYFL